VPTHEFAWVGTALLWKGLTAGLSACVTRCHVKGAWTPVKKTGKKDGVKHFVIPAHESRPSDDPIFALNREATERKARGEAVINATVGALLDDEGKLLVLPSAARAVRDVPQEEWAAYAPLAGDPAFLSAVIDDLFGGHEALRANAIAVATPGGTGALRLALANFLEHGQAMLTSSFYWGPYATLADESDRTLSTFNMFDSAGDLDVDALDRELAAVVQKQGRALVFINDPCHNPTGYSMRSGEWQRVVRVLAKHGEAAPITLLVDMAYFAYAAGDSRAFLSELTPLLGKVLLTFAWSASKSFTHYGLRVGALVACAPDEKLRKQLSAALSYSCRGTWSNCNRGGLSAITQLIREPALAAACSDERDRAKQLLQSRVEVWNELAPGKGLRYPRYEGGFFVTVFADDAQARALRMKEKGVFVVPAKTSLRVALCSVAARDIPRLVDSFSA
jgi:aromatic-amino-acid transaminase